MGRVLTLLPPPGDDTVGPPAPPSDAALAGAIGTWLRAELGDEDLAERMTALALTLRAGGTGVDETCAWVRSVARSWQRHPSNAPAEHDPPPRRHLRLVTAS